MEMNIFLINQQESIAAARNQRFPEHSGMLEGSRRTLFNRARNRLRDRADNISRFCTNLFAPFMFPSSNRWISFSLEVNLFHFSPLSRVPSSSDRRSGLLEQNSSLDNIPVQFAPKCVLSRNSFENFSLPAPFIVN